MRRLLADARQRDGAAAFRAVEEAVLSSLALRLDLPPDARSRHAVAAGLSEAGVPDDLRDRTLALLDACERGQYAPGLPGTPDIDRVVRDAEAVTAALDRPTRPAQRWGRRSRAAA